MGLARTVNMFEMIGLSSTRFVNGVGVFFLATMMLVTTVDVLSRFLFNLPVTGSIEITGFLLLLTIFLGIPYAGFRKQHINIDILTSHLSDRVRLTLERITLMFTLVLVLVLLWQSVEYSHLMKTANRVTAVLRLPIAPFVLVVTFGCLLYCFVLVTDLLKSLNQGIENWKQSFLWFIILFAIALCIYGGAVWLRELPWSVGTITAGVIGMVLLFVVFLSGLPVAVSLILVGFIGMCYLRGTPAGLSIMGASPLNVASKYTFSVIPLFVLMGEFCFFSGIGRDLYDMAYKWVGSLPGGLAMGTVGACGGFAAVCGESMATAVTMGTVALPEMKRYNYDPSLAVGSVASGGTLGVLIPPSLAFILYALLSDQSIALLFIAGVIPGILLTSMFMFSIYFRVRKKPSLGPPGVKTTMREKVSSLKGVWATLLLFALIIGGMYGGVFTPTEGGGIGAFGALCIGVVRRRLNWGKFLSSLLETGKVSAVCLSILIGAHIFGYFLAITKLPMQLATFATNLPVPPLVILIVILVIYLFLGCLMPAIPMLILTVPIFYPVVIALGYDPIWFGVIMVLMFEMAVITPPMGINVLALQSVTQDISLAVMFRGILPFLAVMIVCVALLIIFPGIATFLPSLFGKW